MKIDVVVPYYRQESSLIRLLKSLRPQQDLISSVTVVNDDCWDLIELERLTNASINLLGPGCLTRWLEHEHNGFGVCKSINQGMREVMTEFALIVPADCLLPPNFIKTKLEAAVSGPTSHVLVSGPCHHVQPDSDPADPKIIRTDGYMDLRGNPRWDASPWVYYRGVNRLVNVEAFRKIGGMNEDFDEENLEDYEFTVRWLIEYGEEGLIYEETPVYHQGDPRAGRTPTKPYPLKSARIFAYQLGRLRGASFNLFADVSGEWSRDTVSVGEQAHPAVDVRLPCACPDWIPLGTDLVMCRAFHHVAFPEQFLAACDASCVQSLMLSPFEKRNLPLLEKYNYVLIGRDEVDESVRAIRKGAK